MALFHIYCYADVTYFFPQPAVYHETLLFLLLLLSLQKKKKKKKQSEINPNENYSAKLHPTLS